MTPQDILEMVAQGRHEEARGFITQENKQELLGAAIDRIFDHYEAENPGLARELAAKFKLAGVINL